VVAVVQVHNHLQKMVLLEDQAAAVGKADQEAVLEQVAQEHQDKVMLAVQLQD